MATPDPQFGGSGGLPYAAGPEVLVPALERHRAGDGTDPPRPRPLNRRARRRERRRQEGRGRYRFRDLLEDALDLALDVLLFWR